MTEKPEGHVFIVTYGRSGSTLVQTLLQSIDGYFIRGENANVLWPLYQASQRIRTAKHDHGYREIEPKGPWFGINEVKPDAFDRALVDGFKKEVLRAPSDARVIGFKEIRFHEAEDDFADFLTFIAQNFSPARFVFNVRGWEDVAKSGWWKNCDEEMVRSIVEKSDAMFADYTANHPEMCLTVRYEDYVGKPSYWRRLFDFLGEAYDPAKVEELCARQLKH